MESILFFSFFWLVCYVLLTYVLTKLIPPPDNVMLIGVILLLFTILVPVLGHAIANVNYPRNNEFIKSVEELPIQTVKWNGEDVFIVIISINPKAELATGRVNALRVSDIVQYDPTNETRIYKVTYRIRIWYVFVVGGDVRYVDKNPLE